MSFKVLSLMFFASAVAGGFDDTFSIERDLLPFGIPRQFSQRVASGELLTEGELRACLASYTSIERARLELQLNETELAVSAIQRTMSERQKREPLDEVDKQLDAIEDDLAKKQPLLRDEVEAFLKKRAKYFADRNAFDQTCALQKYDTGMVRRLFPNGISR